VSSKNKNDFNELKRPNAKGNNTEKNATPKSSDKVFLNIFW